MINVVEVKQKILKILEEKGPSLPNPIAKQVELSPVFTSAIMAELLDEKRIKTSSLKFGSSPLYLLPGQEQKLEQYVDENIKGVEKEAYLKLKKQKIIEDKLENPAIRVALRSLKDFAIPVNKDGRLFWKYAFLDEEIKIPEPKIEPQKQEETFKKEEVQSQETKETPKKVHNIFEKPAQKPKSKDSEFLEQIKEFLEKKNIELIFIEESKKRQVIAKVKILHGSEKHDYMLFAFDKKRVSEKDILDAYKKAAKSSLPYYILAKGDVTKKTRDTMNAYKSLLDVEILE